MGMGFHDKVGARQGFHGYEKVENHCSRGQACALLRMHRGACNTSSEPYPNDSLRFAPTNQVHSTALIIAMSRHGICSMSFLPM